MAQLQGPTSTWQTLRFNAAQLANPKISGPEADPDDDGLPNVLEYAMASEPFHRSPMTLSVSRDAGKTIATYTRLPVLDDIAFGWEVSEDLQRWDPVVPTAETSVVNQESAFLTDVTAAFGGDGRARAFSRFRVTLTAGG